MRRGRELSPRAPRRVRGPNRSPARRIIATGVDGPTPRSTRNVQLPTKLQSRKPRAESPCRARHHLAPPSVRTCRPHLSTTPTGRTSRPHPPSAPVYRTHCPHLPSAPSVRTCLPHPLTAPSVRTFSSLCAATAHEVPVVRRFTQHGTSRPRRRSCARACCARIGPPPVLAMGRRRCGDRRGRCTGEESVWSGHCAPPRARHGDRHLSLPRPAARDGSERREQHDRGHEPARSAPVRPWRSDRSGRHRR